MTPRIIIHFLTSIFLLIISSVNASPWSVCKHTKTHATLKDFVIEHCDTDKCRYHSGDRISGHAVFVPSLNSSSLTISLKAKIMHIDMSLPGLDHDACKSSGVHCPIVEKSTVTYPISVIVPFVFFEIQTIAKLELLDERGQHLVCVNIPIEVSKNVKHRVIKKP